VIVKFEREGMIATVELDEGHSHRSVPLSQLNNVPPKESNKVCSFCLSFRFAEFAKIKVTLSFDQGAKAFVIEGNCQVLLFCSIFAACMSVRLKVIFRVALAKSKPYLVWRLS
jgi:hypothetical protein